MDTKRKVEILDALKSDGLFGLVSVRRDSEGVLLYESGATRVGGVPAIEIPHENPHLVDESRQRNPITGEEERVPGVTPPQKTFEKLLSEYGCLAKNQDGFTYVVVDENVASKRPPRAER